jgi:hypothetical protein
VGFLVIQACFYHSSSSLNAVGLLKAGEEANVTRLKLACASCWNEQNPYPPVELASGAQVKNSTLRLPADVDAAAV